MEKKDKEEDLVRFDNVMDDNASYTMEALEHSKLTWNVKDFSFVIFGYSHKHTALVFFFLESSKSKYNSKPQTSISIVSPELKDFCNCNDSGSMGTCKEVIIFFGFDSNCNVDIDDI